jgi:hypothetical protein
VLARWIGGLAHRAVDWDRTPADYVGLIVADLPVLVAHAESFLSDARQGAALVKGSKRVRNG